MIAQQLPQICVGNFRTSKKIVWQAAEYVNAKTIKIVLWLQLAFANFILRSKTIAIKHVMCAKNFQVCFSLNHMKRKILDNGKNMNQINDFWKNR